MKNYRNPTIGNYEYNNPYPSSFQLLVIRVVFYSSNISSVASWTCRNDFKKKKSTTRMVKEVGVGMEVCTCSRVWVISTSIYMYTIIPYTDWMHGYYWATLGWEGQTHLQPGGSTNLTWRWGKVGHFERIKRGGKASVRPPIRTHASERFLDM